MGGRIAPIPIDSHRRKALAHRLASAGYPLLDSYTTAGLCPRRLYSKTWLLVFSFGTFTRFIPDQMVLYSSGCILAASWLRLPEGRPHCLDTKYALSSAGSLQGMRTRVDRSNDTRLICPGTSAQESRGKPKPTSNMAESSNFLGQSHLVADIIH